MTIPNLHFNDLTINIHISNIKFSLYSTCKFLPYKFVKDRCFSNTRIPYELIFLSINYLLVQSCKVNRIHQCFSFYTNFNIKLALFSKIFANNKITVIRFQFYIESFFKFFNFLKRFYFPLN